VVGPDGKSVIDVKGKPKRRQITKTLARVSDDYRTEKDCWPLADEYLVPERRKATTPEGSLTLSEFTERHFLPYIKSKREPSTHKFYKEVHDNHLRHRVGQIKLREFTTQNAQSVLDGIDLSHSSLLRIKTGMSAIFSYAIRLGFLHGTNPVRETKAEGTYNDFEQYAYTLDEIKWMMKRLGEPARTVIAVAAFSGLRESEIRGLQWSDYDGDLLHVRRKVWRSHVGETKTPASKNSVPVIEPLRKILDLHKRRDGSSAWMFAGVKKGFALHLDNLARRDIRPVLGGRWHGWHAFRRGLSTNLFELGVPPEVSQLILRHADAETTRKHYLLLQSRGEARRAMRKLEKALAIKGQIRASRTSRNRKYPHKH
jgi:integrase